MPSADAKDNKKSLDSARPPRRFSNNVAADDAVNFKQIGTQFDGGSLLDLDQDFFRTSCNLVGHVFRIKTKEGKMFEGIFETSSADFSKRKDNAAHYAQWVDEHQCHEDMVSLDQIYRQQWNDEHGIVPGAGDVVQPQKIDIGFLPNLHKF
uniref:Uncharacterized protein n=1 Tax=Romanomermis culicivorax TaxID=13658 RepID=A0A915L214_ROMCU